MDSLTLKPHNSFQNQYNRRATQSLKIQYLRKLEPLKYRPGQELFKFGK